MNREIVWERRMREGKTERIGERIVAVKEGEHTQTYTNLLSLQGEAGLSYGLDGLVKLYLAW